MLALTVGLSFASCSRWRARKSKLQSCCSACRCSEQNVRSHTQSKPRKPTFLLHLKQRRRFFCGGSCAGAEGEGEAAVGGEAVGGGEGEGEGEGTGAAGDTDAEGAAVTEADAATEAEARCAAAAAALLADGSCASGGAVARKLL